MDKLRLANSDQAREFIAEERKKVAMKKLNSSKNTYLQELQKDLDTLDYLDKLVVDELRNIFE